MHCLYALYASLRSYLPTQPSTPTAGPSLVDSERVAQRYPRPRALGLHGALLGSLLTLSSATGLHAAELTVSTAQPTPERPIKAGLTATEAAAYMSVPEGFQLNLVAAEPLIHQPVAFTIDQRGRLWVAEAYTYPLRAPEGQGRDKIVILEDQNQDGSFETRKVFAEGLNLVSGLELGFGGVWVGAAPYLLFIPDSDGNDQPDGPPQVLLDGFGYQDTHETLNAFIWGPDGWLYGCHGVFTHSRVGKPGTPDADRTPLNAGVWRYHPTRHRFEVFAWGTSNPWGVDFNDQGHAFITACVIPHLWHVIQGARYHRQGGQHFEPYLFADIQTIARHRHYVGDIRDHAWWGAEPVPPADTLAAGGGHAHCGAMIYLGDNWPAEYRNKLFMNNIHGNRVNQDVVSRHGSGYVGDRAPDILLANDKWYRGINLKYGPDGSVYLIDWYDPNACHRTNPEIWDRTNGRIYNLSYGDVKRATIDLAQRSDAELVALHKHANDWYVRMSRRMLQERAQRKTLNLSAVRPLLMSLLKESTDVTRQLRALWTLHALNLLDDSTLAYALQHPDENVRGWAIQLEAEDGEISPEVNSRWQQLASSDPSPLVRLYLTSALQRLPEAQRWGIVERLALRGEDREDANLPLMLWYAVEPLVAQDTARAMKLSQSTQIPLLQQFILRRAAVEPETREAVAALLVEEQAAEKHEVILGEILQALEGQVSLQPPAAWQAAYPQLTSSSSERVREQAEQLAVLFGDERIFPVLRTRLVDQAIPLEKRQQALQILVRGRDEGAAGAFEQVLADPPLRSAALRALGQVESPTAAAAILKIYPQLSTSEKNDAVSTLASRPTYARALITALQQEQLPRTDVHAYHVRQIVSLQDAELSQQIQATWGDIRESSAAKQQRMDELKQQLTSAALQAANTGHGRALFDKTCGNCHRLFGQGGEVGPDITGSNRTNLDYLLQNVVDPSAVLGKDYRMTVLSLNDGRVVSGLVKRETPSALTVRTLNDTVVVALADIEDRQLSELSMMPEGLLDTLPAESIRDLVAYLQSPVQVAPSGPPAPIDPQSGKVPGALEGESLKIVGKTKGNVGTQDMRPFTADKWSDQKHLFWTGAAENDQLDLEVPVPADGLYDLHLVLTKAPDYAQVQLKWDDEPLGPPIDLFDRAVITSGELVWPAKQLSAGPHKLSLQIVGKNPNSAGLLNGLDYVRLVKSSAATVQP